MLQRGRGKRRAGERGEVAERGPLFFLQQFFFSSFCRRASASMAASRERDSTLSFLLTRSFLSPITTPSRQPQVGLDAAGKTTILYKLKLG